MAVTKDNQKSQMTQNVQNAQNAQKDTDIIRISPRTGKPMKKPRGKGANSPVIGDNGVHTEPGDNSRYASILLQINQWGNVDLSDVDALEDRFNLFIQFCAQNDIRITNQLTYLALGIDKDDVYDWDNGRRGTRRHAEFIKKVRKFCASYREMLGADGKLNPVTLVWWQKNYDGLVDKQEVVLTPNNPLASVTDPEERRKRIEAAVIEED